MSKVFDEVADRAYGWSITTEGIVSGLTAGDMGYEETGLTITDLIGIIQSQTGDPDPGGHISALVSAYRQITTKKSP